MKIGVLGGTFDPIHLGHLLLAETIREAQDLQQILFVPVADPPHKQRRQITPARHRRAMVELALKGNSRFKLCLIDLERPGPHYSTDTVRLIRQRFDIGPDDCYFIIGSDSLQDLPDWYRPEELITLCRLAVARRPGYQSEISVLEAKLPGLGKRLVWVEMPPVGISASDIRARVQGGRSIHYQVPDEVRHYLQLHRLYRPDRQITNQRRRPA